MELVNKSGLTFEEIDSEESRTYVFPGGDSVTIQEPLALHVSASGGHRLFDGAGVSHYVPAGWIHLFWTAKPGQPHFVK